MTPQSLLDALSNHRDTLRGVAILVHADADNAGFRNALRDIPAPEGDWTLGDAAMLYLEAARADLIRAMRKDRHTATYCTQTLSPNGGWSDDLISHRMASCMEYARYEADSGGTARVVCREDREVYRYPSNKTTQGGK